jgi:hypothetical protein
MAMNGPANLGHTLEAGANEIYVDPEVARLAYQTIEHVRVRRAQERSTCVLDLTRDGVFF